MYSIIRPYFFNVLFSIKLCNEEKVKIKKLIKRIQFVFLSSLFIFVFLHGLSFRQTFKRVTSEEPLIITFQSLLLLTWRGLGFAHSLFSRKMWEENYLEYDFLSLPSCDVCLKVLIGFSGVVLCFFLSYFILWYPLQKDMTVDYIVLSQSILVL